MGGGVISAEWVQQVRTLEGTTHLPWKGQAFPGNKPRLVRNGPLIGDRVTQKKIQGGLGNSQCHSLGWQNNPLFPHGSVTLGIITI